MSPPMAVSPDGQTFLMGSNGAFTKDDTNDAPDTYFVAFKKPLSEFAAMIEAAEAKKNQAADEAAAAAAENADIHAWADVTPTRRKKICGTYVLHSSDAKGVPIEDSFELNEDGTALLASAKDKGATAQPITIRSMMGGLVMQATFKVPGGEITAGINLTDAFSGCSVASTINGKKDATLFRIDRPK